MVIVETFYAGEAHRGGPSARAVAGQGFPADMHVACCREMKNSQPVGTFFKIEATISMRKAGRAIYAARGAPFTILSRSEVQRHVAALQSKAASYSE